MKIFRTLIGIVIAGLVTYVHPVHAATWEDETGPYKMTVVADAGPDKMFSIYRPQKLSPKAHPIAVLCVGTGSHPSNYEPLLIPLASHGIIVIAGTNPNQGDGAQANVGVDWIVAQNDIKKSEYYQKLMPTKVLAIGHSSGGAGVMLASIKNPKITSLLLYAPAMGSVNLSDLSASSFFVSGSLDTTHPPHFVKARYQEVTKAHAWYGEKVDQSHIGFGRNKSVLYYTRAWAYTQLFDDSGTARGCFYGPNWTFKNAASWNDQQKNNNDAF